MRQILQDIVQGTHQLDRCDVAEILYTLDARDRGKLITAMDPLHPADIADLLEQINSFDRSRLTRLYDREFDGEILTEMQDVLREEIIGLLTPKVFADLVRNLETNDVVDLVENLDNNQQEVILAVLGDADRIAVESSLNYSAQSAGRLMQRELVIAPEERHVGDAIDHLPAADNLLKQFYHVTLVNGKMHPITNVSLGRLMATRLSVALKDIPEETLHVIPATQAEAGVAYAFNHYHLISTLVVDEDGRIFGASTIDDAMVVLDEEHEEDILRLAGVGNGSLSDPVLQTTWQRVPWLAANLVTAILAYIAITQFEATIESFLALAILMLIIASMGGNAGTQSLTVAVRALASKDLTESNAWRLIWREVFAGLINGILFAVLIGTVGLIWFSSQTLGYAITLAMVINFIMAGLAGTGVPVILEGFGFDPALASSAFVTTVTDVVGFLAFLGLAAWVLF